jgi:hypothetical protein
VKVPIRPACAGAFKIAWISTYPTVQIRRTTSHCVAIFEV